MAWFWKKKPTPTPVVVMITLSKTERKILANLCHKQYMIEKERRAETSGIPKFYRNLQQRLLHDLPD